MMNYCRTLARAHGWDIPYTLIASLQAMTVFSGNAGMYAARVHDLAERSRAEHRLQDAVKALYASNGSWRNDVATPLTALSARLARAETQPGRTARITSWSAAELLAAQFPEPQWAVPGSCP